LGAERTPWEHPVDATLVGADDTSALPEPDQTGASLRTLQPPQSSVDSGEGSLRILDASSSFELEDLAEFRIPSTIPGADDDGELDMAHRATPSEPEPGQRVGRYLTERILGRGGMGLVLQARDDLLQREVAVKVILPQYLSADPAAGLRFLREAEIVATLTHPHIIRVLDAGLDAGVAFLAFEYVQGDSYAEVRDRGLSKVSDAVDILLPVLSAVSCAHQMGIVHGDLKPTNLILGRDYVGRPHPWVLDFGVSFFSGVDAGLDPMRKKVTGTPGYLAPEWLKHEGVDGRADCFSLGCVLYELLAGKGPFAGMVRLSQAVAAANSRDYPQLSTVRELPEGFQHVVERALCPDPDDRYATLLEFGSALLAYASDEARAHYSMEFLAD